MNQTTKTIAMISWGLLCVVGITASIVAVEGVWGTILLVIACLLVLVMLAAVIWWESAVRLVRTYMALRKCGITAVDRTGIAGQEMEEALRQATSIRIMATTAIHFLTAHRKHLVDALVKQRAAITFLLADADSQFASDIEDVELQRSKGSLSGELGNIRHEIRVLVEEAKHNASPSGTVGIVRLGSFSTLLRSTFILCTGAESDSVLGWLTMTMPPQRCTERGTISFLLKQGDLFDACSESFNAAAVIAEDRGNMETLSPASIGSASHDSGATDQ